MQARGSQDPPTTEEVDNIKMARAGLYMCRLPEGLKVPILVRKIDIKDGIPTEAEVAEAVQGLKQGRVGTP